ERQADARIATGRLDDHGVAVDLAVALAGLDHRYADSVLDRPEGIEALRLGDHSGLGVANDAPQANQGCVADGLGDVGINLATELVWKWHCEFSLEKKLKFGSNTRRTSSWRLNGRRRCARISAEWT